MAEEQDLKMDSEEEENTGGGKKKLIIIIVGVVLLLAIGAGAFFFFMGGEKEETEDDDEEIVEETQGAKETKAELGPITYYDIEEPFIIDFNANGRQRFLQLKLTVMYRDPGVGPVFEKHLPWIRSSLITAIGNRTFKSLRTVEGKQQLSEDIAEELKMIMKRELGREGIDKVLFTEFVMQ